MANGNGGWKVLLDPQTLILVASIGGSFLGQWYMMRDQINSLQADLHDVESQAAAQVVSLQMQLNALSDRTRSLETDDAVSKNRLHTLEGRAGIP